MSIGGGGSMFELLAASIPITLTLNGMVDDWDNISRDVKAHTGIFCTGRVDG